MRLAIKRGTNDMTAARNFSDEHIKTFPVPADWCDASLAWPLMRWVGRHVLSVKTSSSSCETGFSLQALIHTGVRNKQSEKVTSMLLKSSHVYLLLQDRLEQESDAFSWWEQKLVEEAMDDACAALLAEDDGVDVEDTLDDYSSDAEERSLGLN